MKKRLRKQIPPSSRLLIALVVCKKVGLKNKMEIYEGNVGVETSQRNPELADRIADDVGHIKLV